jgi:hypothetical protein
MNEMNVVIDISAPLPEGHAELPSCPRCVERLDTSASGLVPRMSARGALAFSSIGNGLTAPGTSNGGIPWSSLACPVCLQLNKTSILAPGGIDADISTTITKTIGTKPSVLATQVTSSTTVAPKVARQGGSYDSLPRLGKAPTPPASGTTPTPVITSPALLPLPLPSSVTLATVTVPLVSNAAAAAVTALSWTSCTQCSVRGDAREALWMCLICGHIGCGRYQQSHAVQHYQRTHHRYSIELQNQYIWDYIGDGYVHRAGWRTNATTTTPSNGPMTVDCSPSSMNDTLEDMPLDAEEQDMMNTKLQSIELYYDHLLTRY